MNTILLTLTDSLHIEVIFKYHKGLDAVFYLSNGDPGYPGESPSVDIESINLSKGTILELIDWCDSHLSLQFSLLKKNNSTSTQSLFEVLEDLIIKEMISSEEIN